MSISRAQEEDANLLNKYNGNISLNISVETAAYMGSTSKSITKEYLHTDPLFQTKSEKRMATSNKPFSDTPDLRARKKRQSLPAAVFAASMQGLQIDPRNKRGSVTRSFEKIRVKGPVISEEARSKLIVRKQYNPHNTLSNLWLGSAVKLVFYHVRPWALTLVHTILLFLWIRVGCKDGSSQCSQSTYSIRDSLQQFEMGISELSPVFTMCLFVLTFYCNTCINIYRELYFTLTTISTQLKDLSMFLNVFEADPGRRWAIIRFAFLDADTARVVLDDPSVQTI